MNGKMPVSALQELMVARGHPLPVYKEEGVGTNFKCTVYVEDITAVGYGTTKKSAKHESAKNALEKLQSTQEVNLLLSAVEKPLKNYIGELNEYSSKNGFKNPDYECVTALVTGQFVLKCSFLGKQVQGVGINKKEAKQDAARKMLELVGSDNSNITDISRYKLVQRSLLKLEAADTDMVIEMFKKLSVQKERMCVERSANIESTPDIKIDDDQDIKELEKQLKDYNVEYSVNDFQINPYVVCLVIKGTNFTFLATGSSREDALKKVYLEVLTVKKTGCSLNYSLTSFA